MRKINCNTETYVSFKSCDEAETVAIEDALTNLI